MYYVFASPLCLYLQTNLSSLLRTSCPVKYRQSPRTFKPMKNQLQQKMVMFWRIFDWIFYCYFWTAEAYLEPSPTSMMELFCQNSHGLFFRKKAPSRIFDWVLNTPVDSVCALEKLKNSIRKSASRTLRTHQVS